MPSNVDRSWVAALLAMFFSGMAAFAQDPPVRVRGTIEQVETDRVLVKTRDGESTTVRFPEQVKIVAIVRGSLADIKPGSFIGTTATPQPDGGLRAIELHVFPDSMRGTGEGHRPWDLGPTTTMTNGTVAQSVSKVEGNVLTIKYRDGEKRVALTPETIIVLYTLGDRGDLKSGAKIFISAASKQPDGTLQTERLNVGRDGLTPPM
jgi:hypothetical protein